MNAASPKQIARAHWGTDLPDWIEALADACESATQRAVAERIGYSPSTVSQVLRRSYRGDMTGVEQGVRGAYLAGTIACPELGQIAGNTCVQHRKRSTRFANTNPLRIRMYRACRRCPINQGESR